MDINVDVNAVGTVKDSLRKRLGLRKNGDLSKSDKFLLFTLSVTDVRDGKDGSLPDFENAKLGALVVETLTNNADLDITGLARAVLEGNKNAHVSHDEDYLGKCKSGEDEETTTTSTSTTTTIVEEESTTTSTTIATTTTLPDDEEVVAPSDTTPTVTKPTPVAEVPASTPANTDTEVKGTEITRAPDAAASKDGPKELAYTGGPSQSTILFGLMLWFVGFAALFSAHLRNQLRLATNSTLKRKA